MRRFPVLFVGREASIRLGALRELARRLYFSYGSLGGVKEFVLAVSVPQDTLWIWMVLSLMDDATRDGLDADAESYGVTLVDLSIVDPEEAERFRERYVKGTESYQILWDADVDGLFDLFEAKFSTAP
jgi:hypothetical protein